MSSLFASAVAAHQQGRLAEAKAGYLQLLQTEPRHADALHLLGVIHLQQGDAAQAEVLIRRALEVTESAIFLGNLGNLLKNSGRPEEAEAAYRRALVLKPDHADVHNNLGILLRDTGRLQDAEAAFRRAIDITPVYADAQYNLGSQLYFSQRFAEAKEACRLALTADPKHANAHMLMGDLLFEERRLPEAESAYRQALALQPGHAAARLQLRRLLLATGRDTEAWPLFELRLDEASVKAHPGAFSLPYPRWQGQPLAGKSLVVWPEQGYGDYIQFARYATLLKSQGLARLTLACAPPLAALLGTLEGVDAVVTEVSQLPPHDYWVFVMGLPRHAVGLPPQPPYLRALPERIARWQGRLPAGRKVGLVWKGNPAHLNDANRSLPGLAILAPLWAVPGVSFVSLQKGAGEAEAAPPPHGQPLLALSAQAQDFADMAAIVSQLDLVICMDTAIAHLAGAIGKPCWVLLPAVGADGRWRLEGPRTPWYPSLRLFRRRGTGWAGTLEDVAGALGPWATTPL
ncbi:MAG: tetratricopeptide repeat protein [Polaromonas sp.]|nr:tetratricopeptide repeat protein [Polaromonas sp.]